LINIPILAPTPVPTITAVGVAKPRAQGQEITTTEMAIFRHIKKVLSDWNMLGLPNISIIASQAKKVNTERQTTTGTKYPEI